MVTHSKLFQLPSLVCLCFEKIFSGVTLPWPLDEHIVRVKKHLHGGCFLFVDLISASFAGGAPRCGKHALQHAQMTTMSRGEVFSKFLCEAVQRAQSLGDDTCDGRTGKVGMRARTTRRVWSSVFVGLRAWAIDRCSNKDVGRGQSETLTKA